MSKWTCMVDTYDWQTWYEKTDGDSTITVWKNENDFTGRGKWMYSGPDGRVLSHQRRSTLALAKRAAEDLLAYGLRQIKILEAM